MIKKQSFRNVNIFGSILLLSAVLMSCSLQDRANLYGNHVDYKKFSKGLKKSVDKSSTETANVTVNNEKVMLPTIPTIETSAPAINGENYAGSPAPN